MDLEFSNEQILYRFLCFLPIAHNKIGILRNWLPRYRGPRDNGFANHHLLTPEQVHDMMAKSAGCTGRTKCAWVLAPPLTRCATFGRLPKSPPGPQSPVCKRRTIVTRYHSDVLGFNEFHTHKVLEIVLVTQEFFKCWWLISSSFELLYL